MSAGASPEAVSALEASARRVRQRIIGIAATPEGCHLGGSLSSADILTVLYLSVLHFRPHEPHWAERDIFVLSKGHAAAALYAVLAECGLLAERELETYGQRGSRLAGHPLRGLPGVEFPTGSLGHGLSLGVGAALAARMDKRANRVFVLLGDGELQEGSVWEAAATASRQRLDQLVAIVDHNRLQINGPVRIDGLADRWSAFGWGVREVDGHDVGALLTCLGTVPLQAERPSVVIARTVKGKGLAGYENRVKSHYVKLTAAPPMRKAG